MQAPATTFNLGECLEFAWNTFKQHAGDLVIAQLVLAIPYFAASAALNMTRKPGIALLGLLLGPIFWVCSMSVARAAARGQKPSVNEAFRPLAERQGDYLMVCLAAIAGVILCGVGIVLSYLVCIFAPIAALEGRDFQGSVLTSKDLVFKYPADVLLLGILIVALNFAGALACGLGLLVSMPLSCLVVVRAYDQLSAKFALEYPTPQ